MMHLVEVSVCENLKTIADVCFLLGSNVDQRTISDIFACRDHRSRSYLGGFKVSQ